ncbi:hypothetical protein PENTCL1PPCAC_3000, partial [Pristionchus entomophagus]
IKNLSRFISWEMRVPEFQSRTARILLGQKDIDDEIEIRSVESLCLLERLAPEIVWKIIEFVPQTIFNLRLTSRIIQSHVDEYSLEITNLRIVDQLQLTKSESSDILEVEILVPKCKSELIENRLRLLKPQHTTIIQRIRYYGDKRKWIYRMNLSLDRDNGALLKCLRDCLGRGIEKVLLSGCLGQIAVISKILDGIQHKYLCVKCNELTDEYDNQLLTFVETHKVERFHLSFRKVVATEPVKFLHDLSSLVRSLEIVKSYVAGPDRLSTEFFGVSGVEWGPIIIEIFSKKLDKLMIVNHHSPSYLSKSSADTLRERLPQLEKKIWLAVTCIAYENGIENHITNNYHMSASPAGTCSKVLMIKHSSRSREKPDF